MEVEEAERKIGKYWPLLFPSESHGSFFLGGVHCSLKEGRFPEGSEWVLSFTFIVCWCVCGCCVVFKIGDIFENFAM